MRGILGNKKEMTLFTVQRLRLCVSGNGEPSNTFPGIEGALTSNVGLSGLTLERSVSDPLHPCILAGKYKVTVSPMISHGYVMRVLLEGTEPREGIFCHSVNWVFQLLGCIGVGATRPTEGMVSGGIVLADEMAQAVQKDIADSWIEILPIPEVNGAAS